MSIEKSIEKIVKWLTEGTDESKNPAEWVWEIDISRSKEGKIVLLEAFHPKAPLKLVVLPIYDESVIRLIVDPLYPTKFLDKIEKLKLYYSLLRLNLASHLVKTCLTRDDDVIFVVDLKIPEIGKQEFYDAVETLYMTVAYFAKNVGWGDEIEKAHVRNLVEAVVEKARKGETKQQIINYLVKKANIPPKIAEKIAEKAVKTRKEKTTLTYI